MKKFITQKTIAILLILFTLSGTMTVFAGSDLQQPPQHSLEYLYQQAIKDSMTIEPEEVLPVVKLAKDSNLATFNDQNEVLLVTWHRHPDSYIAGHQTTLKYGPVWTFTDKEITQWYQKNKNGVQDWQLRFKQLIGLPVNSQYTHFTAMWVPLEKIKRPAYSDDITKEVTAVKFNENADKTFVQWFNSNIIGSYFEGAYPWTRLGYTYDWLEDDIEYGLSEFLVVKDTTVNIEFTYTTQEFIKWLDLRCETLN
jgi:hypothetical protein